MGDITLLIEQAREGDRAAFDRLFEVLYPELRAAAHRRLGRHSRDDAIDTTALVNECYLKLSRVEGLPPVDRSHFLAYAATVMRSIIVDAARASHAERRGGGADAVPLDTTLIDRLADPAEEILDVDAALRELTQVDARLARVVELRYFGGLSDAEIGDALNISDRTVRRDWEKARLLLAHALRA